MSDTGSGEIASQITKEQVLHRRTETNFLPSLDASSRAHLARLQEVEQHDGLTKKVFDAAKETGAGSFNSGRATTMELRFGGGKAKEIAGTTTSPPSTELDTTKTPDMAETNSYNTAKNAIDGVNSYIQYIDIYMEARRRGGGSSNLDQVIQERRSKGDLSIKDATDFDKARTKGLEMLAASRAMQQMFPELSSLSETQRKDLLEESLGTDAVMRNEVVKRMKLLAAEAENLPGITTDEDYKKAKSENEAKILEVNPLVTDVIASIDADITPPATPLDAVRKAAIEKMIRDGQSPEAIMRSVRADVINNTNMPKLPFLTEIVKLRTSLDLIQQGLASPKADRAKVLDDMQKASDAITAYKRDNNVSDDEENNYNALSAKYSTSKDASGTSYVSGLTQKLSEGNTLIKDIKKNEGIIKQKEADALKSERASKGARLAAESELIDKLENILGESAATTLEKRYDEMIELEKKATTEDGEKQSTADDKLIKDAMKNNWIKYDEKDRSKGNDPFKMKDDMLMLAYQGEEGLKRIMMRELGFQTEQPVIGGTPVMVDVDWRTVDLSSLTDEQKKRLDDVYAKNSNAYRDKLFMDTFLARSLGSKIKDRIPGTDKLGFQKHEWMLLEQNFSGKLTEALSKSKEGSRMLKNLEARGVRPDFKMKWLLYALAAMGVGAVGAVGILPAAAAVASAAPAVGGAVLHGIA